MSNTAGPECTGCPFCNAVEPPPIPAHEEDVGFRPCPYCDTLADEDGYCVDTGCKYCGKAVIENE